MEIRINQKWIELMGTGSLIGRLLNAPEEQLPTEVVLVFEQTSLGWRYAHHGPDSWVMPEYAVPCLVDDILSLLSKGITVKTRIETADYD